MKVSIYYNTSRVTKEMVAERQQTSVSNLIHIGLEQRFSNFFQVGTTFISQNVLRTTLLLGLSNSLGLP